MYFRAEVKAIKRLPVKLPKGYTIRHVKPPKTSDVEKKAWERVYGRKFYNFQDGFLIFIEFKGVLVATVFAYAKNGIGTLHAGMVHPQHRRRGLYGVMCAYGLRCLIKQGITVFEHHTNIKTIWKFWWRVGFKEVDNIASHAKGGDYNLTGKIVSLAFDDGCKSCYKFAFPIMKKFGYVGTCHIITSLVGKSNKMNVDQLHALKSHGWEIGAHSHLHKDLTKLNDEDLAEEIKDCHNWLREHNFKCFSFAYPFGKSNARVRSVVSKYFETGRKTDGNLILHINSYLLEAVPANLFNICLVWLDRFFQNRECEWIILFFHDVVKDIDKGKGCYSITESQFKKILNKIRENGGHVMTIHDAFIRMKKKRFKQ